MSETLETHECELVLELLDTFAKLSQSFQIYGREHPRTIDAREAFDLLTRQVKKTAAATGNQLLIAYHEGQFYLENVPLTSRTRRGHLLREYLDQNEMGGFVLAVDLEDAALDNVLRHLKTSQPEDGNAVAPFGFQWLTREEVFRLQGARRDTNEPSHLLSCLPEFSCREDIFKHATSTLSSFCALFSTKRQARLSMLDEIAENFLRATAHDPQALVPWATVPYFENTAVRHSVKVCAITLCCARRICDSEDHLRLIAKAALLYDLGKCLLPSEVLEKAGPLTPAERRRFLEHPARGATALQRVKGIHPIHIAVAFSHHLKDGTEAGYPLVPPDYRPGPLSCLIGAVDIFAALTSYRTYQRPMTGPEAFDYLYREPTLTSRRPFVDLLSSAVGFHPPGTRVRTNEGRLAVVCGHVDKNPAAPIVRRVRRDDEGRYSLDKPISATCGDLPWVSTLPTGVVVTALSAEEDMNMLGRPRISDALVCSEQ